MFGFGKKVKEGQPVKIGGKEYPAGTTEGPGGMIIVPDEKASEPPTFLEATKKAGLHFNAVFGDNTSESHNFMADAQFVEGLLKLGLKETAAGTRGDFTVKPGEGLQGTDKIIVNTKALYSVLGLPAPKQKPLTVEEALAAKQIEVKSVVQGKGHIPTYTLTADAAIEPKLQDIGLREAIPKKQNGNFTKAQDTRDPNVMIFTVSAGALHKALKLPPLQAEAGQDR